MAGDAKHPEIVIIRRGGHGDHDDHHGGVWKIAFADFMTAMMAFFLVMWLISANDKTRASVARYFNPVRLVDATTQPRGLQDSKKDESGITAPNAKDNKTTEKDGKNAAGSKDASGEKEAKDTKEGAPPQKPETPGAREKRLDTALRENPYVALAEIASAKTTGEAQGPAGKQATPAVIGRRGGESYRDPFAPVPPGAAADSEAGTRVERLEEPSSAKPIGEATAGAEKQQAELKAQILGSAKNLAHADGAGPKVDVRRTDEGVLVSLTDTANYSMFANGSAVPDRRVVLLMEKVAAALKARPGTIVVRGFTDNKPFRSGRYDNWHLSIDRAQVTHYMLVRGGLDDTRIGHIEGFADRGVPTGQDSASPLNRRIEILLKDKAR